MTEKDIRENGEGEEFENKRQSDRKKLIVDVRFEGGDTTGIASTENISVGGLFIKTNQEFEEGAPLRLNLTLDGTEVSINAFVVFIEEGHGVGVRFEDLSPNTEELIKREIQKS